MAFVPDTAPSASAGGKFVPDTQSFSPDAEEPGVGATIASVVAPTIRGAGPYAAGAAAGAAMGAPFGGVGAIPGAIAGAGAVGLTDLASAVYNPVANLMGLPHFTGPSEAWGQTMTKAGLPESATGPARLQQAAAAGMAGGVTQARAFGQVAEQVAPGVMQRVMQSLGMGPKAQMTAGTAAAVSSQAAAEAGAGPVGQWMASLAGGFVPSATSAAAKGIVAGVGSTAEAQARINRANSIGVTPNVAYTSPSTAARGFQKMLSGTEESQAYTAKLTGQLQAEADRIGASVGKAVDTNTAGRVIEKALGREEGGFLPRARVVEDSLWNRWWNMATGKTAKAPGAPAGEMPMPETMAYLEKATAEVPGAPALSELMKDKTLGNILTAMKADMPPPGQKTTVSPVLGPEGKPITTVTPTPGKRTVPYEIIKQLRTVIGEKLEPGNLSPDVSKSALSGLYKVLTRDIETYAKTLGPDAEQAFNRANKFTRGKMDRIETYLQDTQGRKPYEVWRYAASPDSVANGGRQFLTLNRSMAPAERSVFHATFIKQMGRDNTGQFNPQTFLKNYQQLSPMVKSALLPGPQRAAMDRLTRVIGDMEKAGTITTGAQNNAPYIGAYIMLGALLHAHPKALVTAAFASSKSESIAKMLTNKNVVDYVASVNKMPAENAAIALQSFAAAMKTTQPEE